MIFKNLFLAGLIISIVFSGCNKNKNEDTFEELNIDNDETESVTANEESDAIFDEFYEENKPEKQEEIQPPENLQRERKQSEPQFFPNGRFVVQVSCVQSKNFARKIAIKLENKGYPAYIAEVEDPTPNLAGLFHRVRIGGFSTLSSAKTFCEDYLVSDGYEYWIDNRSNDNIGFAGLGLGSTSASKDYEASGKSEQQYSTSKSTPSESTIEPINQKTIAAPSSATAPVSTEAPEQSSQLKPPQESKEMVAEKAPQSNQTEEAPVDPVVQPNPEQTTTSESSEQAEFSESFESSEEDDDWGELDEEWGSDTSDW